MHEQPQHHRNLIWLLALVSCVGAPATADVYVQLTKVTPLSDPRPCPGCSIVDGVFAPACSGNHLTGHAATWDYTFQIALTDRTRWNDIAKVEINYVDANNGSCGPDLCDESYIQGYVSAGGRIALVGKIQLDTAKTLENLLDARALDELGISNWRELPDTIELSGWRTNNAFKPSESLVGHDDHFVMVGGFDFNNSSLGGLAVRGIDIIPEPTAGLASMIWIVVGAAIPPRAVRRRSSGSSRDEPG